jgi:D-alanyl-D-alanine dipeptidase
MKQLTASDFIPLNIFEEAGAPLHINLIYAQREHPDNHFKGLYHPTARLLWAHKDIAPVVVLTSLICKANYGWRIQVNDCFRPVEAQEKMMASGYDPSLVSLPGAGAHPRGMAINMQPIDKHDQPIEMGTAYDCFAEDLDNNPAARNFTRFKKSASEILGIRARRHALETAVHISADLLGLPIYPLPQEWWDFRFEEKAWSEFEPVREAELPSHMHVVNAPTPVPDKVEESWIRFAKETNDRVMKIAAKTKVDVIAALFCG